MTDRTPQLSPKSLVLDLLRVTPGRALPVRALVRVAELFDVSGNALRVTLTRLTQKGLLESDERGLYRLTRTAVPVSESVERWREGEKRLRPWSGAWLCVLPADRARRRKNERTLSLLGFLKADGELWVRPDNLALDLEQVRARLRALGLGGESPCFRGEDFDAATAARWQDRFAKKAAQHARRHEKLPARLRESAARVRRLDLDAALVETFLLGGKAIHALVHDPLLPDEIFSGDLRRALTEEMRRYDIVGRTLWARLIQGVTLEGAPVDLSAVSAA